MAGSGSYLRLITVCLVFEVRLTEGLLTAGRLAGLLTEGLLNEGLLIEVRLVLIVRLIDGRLDEEVEGLIRVLLVLTGRLIEGLLAEDEGLTRVLLVLIVRLIDPEPDGVLSFFSKCGMVFTAGPAEPPFGRAGRFRSGPRSGPLPW